MLMAGIEPHLTALEALQQAKQGPQAPALMPGIYCAGDGAVHQADCHAHQNRVCCPPMPPQLTSLYL